MQCRVAGVLMCALLAAPAAAQSLSPGPPGPYVIDVRGATLGVPQDPAFFPAVPEGTLVPTRGFGLDVGAHVYPLRFGSARVGFGVGILRLRGTASPPTPAGTSTSTTTPAAPVVVATLTTLAPQVSLNFGTSDGWSYVSGGIGVVAVRTSRSEVVSATVSRDSGWLRSFNVGGGARWFTNAHVAFAFEVRFYLVQPREQQTPFNATPRRTLVAASVGLSLR